MSDTPDQEDSQGSNTSDESLPDLCRTLCELVRTRSSGQELENCCSSIVDLCKEYEGRLKGRSKVSMKSFAATGSVELRELVSAFEVCRDLCALHALLLCVDAFLNIPRNLKRVRMLVSANAVFSLIKCFQYFNRNIDSGPEQEEIMEHLTEVLQIIARRDRKSGLKLRLSGFLQQAVAEVCKASRKDVRASSCLLDLLIFAARSGRNAVAMGKNGEFISWLVGTLQNPADFTVHQLKRNCQLLFFLSRTRKNRQKLLGLGCISILLELFKSYIRARNESDYTEICLITLGCLKQMAKTKAGKDQLVAANGLSVCEDAIRSCSEDITKKLTLGEAEAMRELHRSLCALCMRCLPSTPYPLAQVPFPVTFPLPSEAKSLKKVDEDGPESDDDEFEDEEMDMIESEEENDTLGPDGKTRKPKGDFSVYDKFFVEFSQEMPRADESPSEYRSDAVDSPVLSTKSVLSVRGKQLKKRSSSVGSERDSLGGSPLTRNKKKVKSRTNSIERNSSTKSNSAKSSTRKATKGLSSKKLKSVDKKQSRINSNSEGSRSVCGGPIVDEEDYIERVLLTRHVMSFVKIAYPDWKSAYPDLPLQPLKDFPRAVEHNVVGELQRYKNTGSFSARTVYDLDSLLKLDKMRTANGKANKNNDLDRIGKKDLNCETLKFESRFECGNLRRSVQVAPYEYELHLSPDVNQLAQHFQWFYFEVSNMLADVPYSFKIVNCLKSHSMFSHGMQPVLFSVSEAADGRPGWVRAGNGVCYYRNLYTQPSKKKVATECRGYYSIAFSVTFRHAFDVCYIAYHFPYTYTMLRCQLNSWTNHLSGKGESSLYFRNDPLCQTLSGNEMNLLTITARGSLEEIKRRNVIFLSARVHPGESNASWMMLGTIRLLLSDHPKAVKLRKHFVFKVVPMLNPDGVINGSHRCSLVGQDLNRQWSDPNPVLHPTIFHAKALLAHMDTHGRTPVVFCDFHGHSRRCNVFVYGNNPEESWWLPDHTSNHRGEYLEMPEILDVVAPGFSLRECRFVVEKPKEACARVATWRQFGIKRAYTMESTYCGFDQGPYAGFHTGTRELAEMGERFCEALLILREKIAAQSRGPESSNSETDD